jgi:ketosteroid isomerase-like protein
MAAPPSVFEMTREDALAACRELYRQRARGDFENALALFHDDAVYLLQGSRALLPAAGLRVGKTEIMDSCRAFDVDFEIVDIDVDDFVALPPRLCYLSWRMTLRNRGTGAQAEIEGVDRTRWQDGKIVKLTRFLDTALLAALAPTDEHGD